MVRRISSTAAVPPSPVLTTHVVQLFDSLESRCEAIAAFVRDGLARGDRVLVVATPLHWGGAAKLLGLDTESVIATGQLTVADANVTLGRFTRNRFADPQLFEASVGATVRQLATGARLRIYGEMVDLLAEQADFIAAGRLEHLWNELGTQVPFTLFCGYSAVHFGNPRSTHALELICACHTDVRTSATDELGTWLVNRAATAS